MTKRFLTTILLLLPFSLFAQDWKTVSNTDTVYFQAGKHTTGYTNPPDSGIVKAIWVTSSQLVNGDSLFHFFTCARSTDSFFSCIDTLAPSWLGPSFIRKADGLEYYFNSMGDTITMKTKAALGDSWVIAKDSNGLEYRATVMAVGLALVDSIQDSTKTVSLQAYQNNIPVSAWYNSQVLQLSRDHGWLIALDLFRFPNRGSDWEGYGAIMDSGMHIRLPLLFKNTDTARKDFSWKYQTGNVWIERSLGYADPMDAIHVNEFMIRDSVVSSTVTADTAVVLFKTDKYSRTWHFHQGPPNNYWDDSISVSTYSHQDTMINSLPVLVRNTVFPELTQGVLTANSYTRYFTDTFCGNKYLLKVHQPDDQIVEHQGCWQLMPNLSGFTNIDQSYLPGFGAIFYQYKQSSNDQEIWTEQSYPYLKIGSCVWGSDINVIALGVQNQNARHSVSVYPNPAKDNVFISGCCSSEQTTVTLFDIMGRMLQQFVGSTSTIDLSLKGYSAGVYILSVRTNESIANYKLQIE